MTEKTRRKTQITIETHTFTKITQQRASPPEFCQTCQQTVRALPAPYFARLLNITLSELCRELQSGSFHLIRDAGVALVCTDCINTKSSTGIKAVKI